MTNKILAISLLSLFNLCYSQSNSLTSSPYSLFGLGKINESNIGITNSLGKSGVALGSEYQLNGLNPASLASIKLNTFFFDVGLKAEYNYFGDKTSETKKSTYSFSNISLGFPVNKKSGLSLSLTPYTEVGYNFDGLVSSIDGSTDTFSSTINGTGGLNNLNINYGRKITNKMNVGISARYLFGSIKETEVASIEDDYIVIEDKNYYNGFNFGIGIQYQLLEKLNLSSVLNLGSDINGSRDRLIYKVIDGSESEIENSKNNSIKKYKTPTEITFGIKYNFLKNYVLVSDFKRSFWSSLDLKDNIGKYVNSSVFGFGIERFKNSENRKTNFRYRAGFNFDDGNLSFNDRKISTYTYYLGLGIPFGTNSKTFLNISYSYGSKGVVSNILVKEKYHSLSLNINFADNWFVKRKYD